MKLWTVKITTFLLWALAMGSAAFWVLQNVYGAVPANAVAAAKSAAAPDVAVEQNLTPQVAAALGAKNPLTPTAASTLAAMQSRFQLQGVVAQGSTSGAALISVDGKPAKPYPVGSSVEDGLQVISVMAREASFGKNGVVAFTLELPLKK